MLFPGSSLDTWPYVSLSYRKPSWKYKCLWKIPEISLGSSPLGLMILSLMEVIQEPIFIPVINHVLFGQLAQNCLCSCCGVSQTVKQTELLAYAVQAVGMPKVTLNRGDFLYQIEKNCGSPWKKMWKELFSKLGLGTLLGNALWEDKAHIKTSWWEEKTPNLLPLEFVISS